MNDNDRFERIVLLVSTSILPICGVSLLWAGAAGRIPLGISLGFSLLAIVGTMAAVHEIREDNKRRAQLARVRKQVEADRLIGTNVVRLRTWGERIKAANNEMGIREPIRARKRA